MELATKEFKPQARAKQVQIRSAAERLFLERGFERTSTDAIATDAGVSKQTLYVYYPSKEAIFTDVLRHFIQDDPENRLPVAVDGMALKTPDDVRRALNSLAQGLIEHLMQPRYLALIRVVIAETSRLPQLGSLFRSEVPELILGNVSMLLERARVNGAINAVDLDAASRMFVGPLLTYAILDGLLIGAGPPRPPAPEQITVLVNLFMSAIV